MKLELFWRSTKSLRLLRLLFLFCGFCTTFNSSLNKQKGDKKSDRKLTWILEERGRRSVLSHRHTLMILVHDIRQWDCGACEKHVLTQILRP